MSKQEKTLKRQNIVNPFPGLRHYRFEEWPYYYIESRQQDDLLSRLSDHNFLAVVGEPGCGKASLLNCGLVPLLDNGFMGKAGNKWGCVIIRPGTNPIRNLAEGLAVSGMFFDGGRVEPSFTSRLEEMLRTSSDGLRDIFNEFEIKEGYNLFLAIDELEDIFILQSLMKEENKGDNTLFVNLLLRFLNKGHPYVYVMFALASDYLGASSQYPGLPEAINSGQYLLTKPDVTQLRKLIHHAFKKSSIPVDSDLPDLIMEDYIQNNGDVYQLQYACKRLVDLWMQDRSRPKAITTTYYQKLGDNVKVRHAIEIHANHIYDKKLNSRDQKICELLFKAITKDIDDGIEQSWAIEVHRLAKIAHCSVEQMISVISVFSHEGLDLVHIVGADEIEGRLNALEDILTNPFSELTAYSKVMLLSLAFLRSWDKLREWRRNEKENAEVYERLVQSELLNREGAKKLYVDPELAVTVHWRDHAVHNEEWAKRYALSYNEALDYLSRSEAQKEADRAKNERDEARNKKRSAWIRRGLIATCIGFSILTTWAINEQNVAKEAKKAVDEKKKELNFIQNLDSIHTIYIDALEDVESAEVNLLVQEINTPGITSRNLLRYANKLVEDDAPCKSAITKRLVFLHQAKQHWRGDSSKTNDQSRELRLHQDSLLIHNVCIVLNEHCFKQRDSIDFYRNKCLQHSK